MKKNKTLKSVILVLIVAVAITGCASPASVKRMVPSFDHTSFISTNMTLMIAEVKGGEKTNPMLSSKIENEGFKEALTNTLKGSGIFKEVFTDEKGDYKIYAEIISQGLKLGFPTTSILFVNYRLIETTSDKEVWKENILSQYDAKFEEAFLGNVRAKKANEAAVRDNLTRLIKKLSNVLSKLNEK
jgi:hypothetical protein